MSDTDLKSQNKQKKYYLLIKKYGLYSKFSNKVNRKDWLLLKRNKSFKMRPQVLTQFD